MTPETIKEQDRKNRGHVHFSYKGDKTNKASGHIKDNRPESILRFKLKGQMENSVRSREGQSLIQMIENTGQSPIFQKRTKNTGLPDYLKMGIEHLSGHSMDDVKVHYNSSKPAQLQAHAFAQGTEIHLGPGQGKYLPHEAWHVAQQKQGRVRPIEQTYQGLAINNDSNLEREADVMGRKALNLKDNRSHINHIRNLQQNTKIPVGQRQHINKTPLIGNGIVQGKFGGKLYNYLSGLPKPFTVSGAIDESPAYYTAYKYDVQFTYNNCIATVNLRTITDTGVDEQAWQAYKKEVEEKVSEVFDDKINITFSGEDYPLKVKVNLFKTSSINDVEGGDYPQVNFNTVRLHKGQGRADAANFRVDGDGTPGARGYIAAHEIGHHLGLYDEYSDAKVPKRATYNDGSIMTETWPRYRDNFRPGIKQRHIMLIKSEIEQTFNQNLEAERIEAAQEARRKKMGIHLPI